jgi:HEAT repeat-containing taxis protein
MTGERQTRTEKLIRRLTNPDPVIQIHAGILLGDMGTAARGAVPTLLELLRGESVQGRKLAAMTLGNIGVPEAVPALQQALDDGNEVVRKLAAGALAKIRPTAQTRAA